jgi:hypothetical protein
MKTRLEVITQLVQRLRDQASQSVSRRANDDELMDELDNALLHLEAASDRLIAMDEEVDEEPEAPINDRYCPHCGETDIAIDDSECHHCEKPLYSY